MRTDLELITDPNFLVISANEGDIIHNLERWTISNKWDLMTIVAKPTPHYYLMIFKRRRDNA